MIGTDSREELFDNGMLLLDPDIEQLFAEMDAIVAEALARWPTPQHPRQRVRPERPPRAPAHPALVATLRGRRPPGVQPTQRGPPQRAVPPRPAEIDTSEVMPLFDTDSQQPSRTQSLFAGRPGTLRAALGPSPDRTQGGNAMTPFPTGSDADRSDQLTLAYATDLEAGLDTTEPPLTTRIREAFDHADTVDRIDQAWITPLPDDDYPLAY